jgi:hypothetical protein
MRLHVPGVTVFSLFVVAALALLVRVLASINRQWAGSIVQKRHESFAIILCACDFNYIRGCDSQPICNTNRACFSSGYFSLAAFSELFGPGQVCYWKTWFSGSNSPCSSARPRPQIAVVDKLFWVLNATSLVRLETSSDRRNSRYCGPLAPRERKIQDKVARNVVREMSIGENYRIMKGI